MPMRPTSASSGCGATSARQRPSRPASSRPPATSSSRSTATCRTIPPRSRACSRSWTRASTSSPAGRRGGGLGLLLGAGGIAVLVYLTVVKIGGYAIGQRPLLTLGVLLVVVGLQFFSLGLIGEMITSHHEERARERDAERLHVDEILS